MTDNNERFQLLLKEIELIQSRIDKFEVTVYRIRQITSLFMISLLVASYSSGKPLLALVALVFASVGFIYESHITAHYIKGLVSRHRLILTALNTEANRNAAKLDLSSLDNIFDPFDEFDRTSQSFTYAFHGSKKWPSDRFKFRSSHLFYVPLVALIAAFFVVQRFF